MTTLPARVLSAIREVFALDLRMLACFRIGLGLVLLVDLGMRAGDLSAHYTDDGVLPVSLVRDAGTSLGGWSLHLVDGSPLWQGALFVAAALAALSLLAGNRTRLSTAASWLLLLSLHHRADALLHSGDELLALLLFWGMFLPLGARWSVDAGREPLADPTAGVPRLSREHYCSVATAGLILQVCCLYVAAGLLKTGDSWRDGTAVQLALNIDEYATPVAGWVLQRPWLTRMLTHATVGLELFAPLLLLCPVWFLRCRWLAVLALAGMQVGFMLCMQLGIFPWVNLVALVALLRFGRLEVAPRTSPVWPAGVLAGVFAAWMLVLTVADVATSDRGAGLPGWSRTASDAAGLNQRWSMFAPDPTDYGGWYVAEAELVGGRSVDLFADGAPSSWDLPTDVLSKFPSDRWKSLLTVLHDENPADGALRRRLCEYLTTRWNQEHPPGEWVLRLRIHYMRRDTRPDGTRGPIEKHTWDP